MLLVVPETPIAKSLLNSVGCGSSSVLTAMTVDRVWVDKEVCLLVRQLQKSTKSLRRVLAETHCYDWKV